MKTKYLWLTFGIALVLIVPLRLYQLFFLMDEQGFYTDGDLISWILMGLLFVSMVLLIVFSLTSKHTPKRYSQVRSIPNGIVQIGLGAAAVVYSISEIVRLAAPQPGESSTLTGGLLYVAIILAFFGVGAGVVWLMNGVGALINKNLLRWIPTAGILPPLWLAIKLFTQVVQFSGNTVTLNTTENQYDTMTIILMTLYVFNQCKMIAGAQGRKCGKRVYAYGLPMILFGVTSALPSFVSLATGSMDAGSFGLLMSIVVGLLCISALIFLLVLPKGEQAYEEEFCEIAVEQEEEPKGQESKAQTQQQGIEQEEAEPEKPKEPLFFRIMRAILKAIASLRLKRKKKKRKVIPWEPGELDEPATKRMDETWRLDFYGFDNGEDKPYYPKIYDVTPEEQERVKRTRELATEEPPEEPDKKDKKKK